MLTVEGALEGILSRVGPLSAERVEIMGALGRVLAEPIVSRATIPPWPNSSMDGYAVRAQDTNGEPVELAIVGKRAALEQLAGETHAEETGAAGDDDAHGVNGPAMNSRYHNRTSFQP